MSENKDLILVIGGTGKTGRRVVERLEARGLPVRIGTPRSTPPFDWLDPSTWAPAVEGVESAYVAYHSDLTFGGAPDRVRAFADVAVKNGVRHLVLLSGRNEPGAHLAEQAVQESGADWTIVRSSFFAQDFSEYFWREDVLNGEVAFPAGNTKEPFIDVEDIADVAAAALMDERHRNQLYEVTGPRLLTFHDAVAEISTAIGREVRYVPISADEFASALAESGMPPEEVTEFVDLFTMILDGRSEYLSDGVKRALGREPRDFSDFARDAAASGAWDVPAESAARR
ncbi:MAG TPA: NAD(P)H-binding protein [Acidimicrobiia bacterium]|nr:NAD(P)H-binding protein [Acidimicrobiia bacterium]